MPHALRGRLRDVLRRTVATPAGGASATSGPIDAGEIADLLPDAFLFVEAPALTVDQLPDGESLTYAILGSRNRSMTSPDVTTLGTQTGAGGAGAAAAMLATRLPGAGPCFALRITASASAAASHIPIDLNVALDGAPKK
jgi:hypothetical protein